MELKDKDVLKWLEAIDSAYLRENIEYLEDYDIDGRSDIQVFADELSYALSCFEEGGHVLCDDLENAREMLSETRYGKVIPLNPRTLKPLYSKSEVQMWKDVVNEWKRMSYRYSQLKKAGVYGKWY